MPDRRVVPAPSSERPDIDRLADELRNWRPDSSYPAIDRAEFDAALDELVALARDLAVAHDEAVATSHDLLKHCDCQRAAREAAEARVAELEAALRERHTVAWTEDVQRTRSEQERRDHIRTRPLAGDGGGV